MQKIGYVPIAVIASCAILASCVSNVRGVKLTSDIDHTDYRLSQTAQVLLTSEAGDKVATKDNASFQQGRAAGVRVAVRPDVTKQTVVGIGSSFTESSAFVLAHLDKAQRLQVMQRIYGDQGANFFVG